MKHEIRIPLGKIRNPFGDDYEGSHNAGKHEPPKEKYRPNWEALVEEEEHLLDGLDEQEDDESDANWREYLASQQGSMETGKVTPK